MKALAAEHLHDLHASGSLDETIATPQLVDLVKQALTHAARGWRVLPLEGKIPILKKWPTLATTDPDTIRTWWTQRPTANVGIATGEQSGLLVLDVDPANGGEDTLSALEAQYGALPQTVEVITGTGGRHYYFQHSGGAIRNSAGKLGPGLDVRSEGGQVVAPPSLHPDTGRAYEWEAAHHPDDMALASVPEWLLDKLTAKPERTRSHMSGETILRGQRNSALTRLGGAMRRQGATKAEILVALTAANSGRCMPALADGEVRRIAESVGRYLPAATSPSPISKAATSEPRDEPFRCTDVSNAELFARQHRESIRYCFGLKQWLVWDGQRWKPDRNERVMTLAKCTARSLYGMAELEPDESRRKALAKWAVESETERRLKSMLSLAQSELGIDIDAERLDADPLLLNVLNGTLDLRTGHLRSAHREDFITKMAPVEYRPEATSPLFERMLNQLFDTVPTTREYLQRILGYALSGLTSEQCFFLLYGTGCNGKSVLLRTILDLLGDYGAVTRPETFLTKRGEGIPNDVAALAGARFVVSLESEQGKQLSEGLVKGMTGGDKLSARFLNREYFSFAPQLKIFIGTNHKPTIRGTDHGIWRRVRCIPFEVVIPPNEQDKHLPDHLRTEFSGILNWLVQGCLAWQRDGLGPPIEVQVATATYRAEQDLLGTFLKDQCVVEPDAKSTKKVVYDSYLAWCEDGGERHRLSMRGFSKVLRERGLTDAQVSGAKGWRGIRIITPLEGAADDAEPVTTQGQGEADVNFDS
ncbi:MAG: bifunctional DNA primase/polymerase [Nitrospirota bacterium]|nr:bifunctional DNA primase/polymerase [Nitrospirota bacterium]